MVRVLLRSLQAVGSGLRAGWLILGATLILIVMGEAGLRLVIEIRDGFMPTERWTRSDMYHDAVWARDFFIEHRVAERFAWAPYVHWRRYPYQGRYIEVARDGRRTTWNPPPRDADEDPPPVRVFTFGGSTMWGWGARDDYTVASHLSKLLHEEGYRAEVTNYGEIAYVSTQEVIALLRCIHRDDIPDIAIFYDGINDVVSSYKHGAAGLPLSLRGGSGVTEPERGPWAAGQQFLSGNFWGLRRFTRWLGLRIRPLMDTGQPQAHPSSDELARQTVHVYEANLALVETLGRRYGFEPLFYWQPVIFSKQQRSPHEQATVEYYSHYKKAFFDDTYRRVRQSKALNGNPRFHNISDLFDDAEEPYYMDKWHVSEPGNRLIAAAMVDEVIELIAQRRAPANAVIAR